MKKSTKDLIGLIGGTTIATAMQAWLLVSLNKRCEWIEKENLKVAKPMQNQEN